MPLTLRLWPFRCKLLRNRNHLLLLLLHLFPHLLLLILLFLLFSSPSEAQTFDFDRLLGSTDLSDLDKTTPLVKVPYPLLKQKLIKQLMRHYRRYERPTEGTREPTRVRVSIKILAITSVDVINMQYTADMMLVQTWTDPRLRWSHLPEYAAIRDDLLLTHKRNEIWLPDLFFRNGKEGFLYRMTVPNHKIRVSPEGRIYLSQKITMRLACEMHLRNFPLDQQDCDMDIGSYGYTLDQLKFIWDGENALRFADDVLISEFNTPSTTWTEDCTAPQTTSTGTYTCLLGRFQLKRQIGSYLVGTYIPAFLIVIVSWLTFWVSPDAIPARVTLGLLTLISLLTKIASLNNTLPRVSYIKAIDIWLIACLLFVVASMLEFTLASYWSRKVFHSKWRDQVRQTVRANLDRVVCPCCSPKSHKLLLRCTCCGIINPQYEELEPKDLPLPALTTTPSNSNCCGVRGCMKGLANRGRGLPRCGCGLNNYRAVKFDVPPRGCNQIDCNQIYDNKGALDYSPILPARHNKVPHKSPYQPSPNYSQTCDRKCCTSAVLVASPRSTRTSTAPRRSSVSKRPPVDAIQMSNLPPGTTSTTRRRKHKVTFSPTTSAASTSGRKSRSRDSGTALCPQHPLPERYLRVREVEIDEEEEEEGQCSGETGGRRVRTTSGQEGEEDGDLNSEIDAYSRFLFPCCFILFNCAYWGFYLVISDPGFALMSP